MSDNAVRYLKREGAPDLAYIYTPADDRGADLPIVMFCGGFRSDMMGTKAEYFENQCKARGQAYLRFDYSGHGLSGGAFKGCTISTWLGDSLAIFDVLVNGPVVVVGSSMGGWIGLLMARERSEFVKGYIGIAAAPDFTQRLYDDELSDEHREAIEAQGYVEIPNEYSDEPYIFTKALFEDGANNFVLSGNTAHDYPIILFHGRLDTTVPESAPLAIQQRYSGSSFEIVFIDDGDHRLSTTQDLEMINQGIARISGV